MIDVNNDRPSLDVFLNAQGQAIGLMTHDNIFLSKSLHGPFDDEPTLVAALKAIWPNLDYFGNDEP